MSNIQEQIFQAIDIITDKKVKELKFDKTIEGLIVSDTKADSGEYEVQYQDIRFTAYSSNNTTKFKKDENVLILIPDGDMNNKKTILSSSRLEGQDYVDIGDIVIDKLGINFLDEADDFEIELSTIEDSEKFFKLKGSQMVSLYPGKKMIWIGANFETDIDTNSNGDYGIEIKCKFINSEDQEYYHTFKISLVDIVGNPYKTNGYKYTQLPLLEDRLIGVEYGRAYSKDFRTGNKNIKISKIEIEYVKARDQDGSEYTGNIITPQGTFFKNEVLFPSENLDLIMQFKQKGQVLDTDAVRYKWFIMDPSVENSESPGYNSDAGIGWKELKQEDYSGDLISGIGTKAITVWANFVPTFETFKCIAYYKAYVVSDMVTVVDYTEEASVEITSSNGASFVNGVGETLLTCITKQGNKEIDTPLFYEWMRVTEEGNVETVKKGEVNDNTLKVSASEIGIKKTYICEVKPKKDGATLVTGNIALVNIVDGSTQGIVVIGGFRTALYNAEGRAPEGMLLKGFQFDFYKNGKKITENIKHTWTIPSQTETLLKMNNGTVQDDGTRTSTDNIIYLDLEKDFDLFKSNNTLTIDVEHTEGTLTTTTREVVNISITKVGNNGADGAGGSDGIDGSTYVYEIQGGSPTIVYDKDGLNPNPSTLGEFYLMFSKDGNSELAKEVEEVIWEVPSGSTCALSFNGQTSRIFRTKKTDAIDGGNPHKVTLVADESWTGEKYNNYLSAKIIYNDKMKFNEYYPVAITKNGSDGEMGYAITTLPPSRVFHFNEKGYIEDNREFLITFNVIDGAGELLNYTIQAFQTDFDQEAILVTTAENNTSLKVVVKSDQLVPDSGSISASLRCNGKVFRQVFSFTSIKDGFSPVDVSLYSTNGLVFKRGEIQTVVYAVVRRGMEIINNEIPNTNKDNYVWTKIDEDGKEVVGWVPTYYDGQYDKIIISPNDIDNRATFNCSVKIG